MSANSIQRQKIFGLDLLRAFAIILVFIWHYRMTGSLPGLHWLSPFAWIGVDLFFVLSGYLITFQLLQSSSNHSPPSIKKFYIKRGFRILPAYWTVLALYFLIPGWSEGNGLPPLWKFLTFTQNFFLDRGQASGFSHAWSLCVEEHFYLLLPLLVSFFYLFKSKMNVKLGVIALISFLLFSGMVLRGFIWLRYFQPVLNDPTFKWTARYYDQLIYYPSYCRLDGLLIGTVIAILMVNKSSFKTWLERSPNLPAFIGALVLALATQVVSDRTSLPAAFLGFPLISIGFGGLLISATSPRSFLNRWNIPGVSLIATLAYSFYLIHKAFIHLFYPVIQKYSYFQDKHLIGLSVFCLCLLGSLVLYFAIERPFLQLREKFLNRYAVRR